MGDEPDVPDWIDVTNAGTKDANGRYMLSKLDLGGRAVCLHCS